MRPPLSRSSVVVWRATICGRRRASGVTSAPIRTRVRPRGNRRQRDPRVGDLTHRRPVLDVVPDEEAVPPGRFGLGRDVCEDARIGQLAERRHEQTEPRGAHPPGRLMTTRRDSVIDRTAAAGPSRVLPLSLTPP